MFFPFSSFLLLVDLLHLGGFGLVSALQDWVGDKRIDMIWGMAWHGMAWHWLDHRLVSLDRRGLVI
jgi:hypothetical protein